MAKETTANALVAAFAITAALCAAAQAAPVATPAVAAAPAIAADAVVLPAVRLATVMCGTGGCAPVQTKQQGRRKFQTMGHG